MLDPQGEPARAQHDGANDYRRNGALPNSASRRRRADRTTFAYRLSLEAMCRMERDDPDLAHAFHRLVIRTLAERLEYANREVIGLRR